MDGSNRWTVQTEGFIVGLSATDETVYAAVGGKWTGIIALSATDGTEQWRKELLQPRYAPTISNNLYMIVEESKSIGSNEFEGSPLSLSAADGTVRWEHPLTPDSEGPSASAFANGTVYIGGSDVIAVDTDGEEIWRNPDGGHNLAVAHGTVYVSFSPGLRTLLASDGSKQWEYVVTVEDRPAEDAHSSAPAVVGETVYFGLTDYAREDAAGYTLFQQPMGPSDGPRCSRVMSSLGRQRSLIGFSIATQLDLLTSPVNAGLLKVAEHSHLMQLMERVTGSWRYRGYGVFRCYRYQGARTDREAFNTRR